MVARALEYKQNPLPVPSFDTFVEAHLALRFLLDGGASPQVLHRLVRTQSRWPRMINFWVSPKLV